ncbi:MAG: response regulator, partial [Acidimicrobiia bacterium]|nr:response regulator [Acidimicrobiia bacterium]
MTTTRQTHEVLIVDDEPMVREVVAQYLEMAGFKVRSASDGAAALLELNSS